MKFEVHYKNHPKNKKLTDYAEAKIDRVEKYELKPSAMKVVFSAKHHECHVEISVRGPDLYCRGTALADDHYTAIDRAMDKLEKQLARHKSKVQFHKRKTHTREGILARMNDQMEHNFHGRQHTRRGPRAA